MKATATSPLVKDGKRLTRRFLGVIDSKLTIERNEFKAYLKGHQMYPYGRYESGQTIYHPVRQEYFYI
jgi:hypothetical protein